MKIDYLPDETIDLNTNESSNLIEKAKFYELAVVINQHSKVTGVSETFILTAATMRLLVNKWLERDATYQQLKAQEQTDTQEQPESE